MCRFIETSYRKRFPLNSDYEVACFWIAFADAHFIYIHSYTYRKIQKRFVFEKAFHNFKRTRVRTNIKFYPLKRIQTLECEELYRSIHNFQVLTKWKHKISEIQCDFSVEEFAIASTWSSFVYLFNIVNEIRLLCMVSNNMVAKFMMPNQALLAKVEDGERSSKNIVLIRSTKRKKKNNETGFVYEHQLHLTMLSAR